jgi:hypothetical protein
METNQNSLSDAAAKPNFNARPNYTNSKIPCVPPAPRPWRPTPNGPSHSSPPAQTLAPTSPSAQPNQRHSSERSAAGGRTGSGGNLSGPRLPVRPQPPPAAQSPTRRGRATRPRLRTRQPPPPGAGARPPIPRPNPRSRRRARHIRRPRR